MDEKRNQRVTHIKASVGWRDINFYELYEYRDLIKMLVKRYFTAIYKQTILGPAWILLNPLITTLLYSAVFGRIVGIHTDDIPHMLFYLCGTTLWGLFSTSLNFTQNTFINNRDVFSKVYFPRLASPFASMLCACMNYFIQFVIFLAFFLFYLIVGNVIEPNIMLLLVPLLILQTAFLGTGVGIFIASMTVKYRDIGVLFTFALQLWMYVTPVIYPMSAMGPVIRAIFMINPMAPIMEAFRYAFFGKGEFSWLFLGISAVVTAGVMFFGVILYNHAEKTCVDTL